MRFIVLTAVVIVTVWLCWAADGLLPINGAPLLVLFGGFLAVAHRLTHPKKGTP